MFSCFDFIVLMFILYSVELLIILHGWIVITHDRFIFWVFNRRLTHRAKFFALLEIGKFFFFFF